MEQVTDTSKQREGELRNSGVKLTARRMDQLEGERSIEISPADVCKVRVPTLRKQSAEPSAEDATQNNVKIINTREGVRSDGAPSPPVCLAEETQEGEKNYGYLLRDDQKRVCQKRETKRRHEIEERERSVDKVMGVDIVLTELDDGRAQTERKE